MKIQIQKKAENSATWVARARVAFGAVLADMMVGTETPPAPREGYCVEPVEFANGCCCGEKEAGWSSNAGCRDRAFGTKKKISYVRLPELDTSNFNIWEPPTLRVAKEFFSYGK